jgi:hypothetical protein
VEWKNCKCQLCDGEAKFKELDSPEQRKYSCPACQDYVLAFQLEDYPDLKDKVLKYSAEIAELLQKIRGTCNACVEIVLHDGLVKSQNQISLNHLIQNASKGEG